MSDLVLDLSKFVEHGVQNMEQIARDTYIDVGTAVVYDTPADTGRLKGNWIPKIGEFAENTLDIEDVNGADTIKKIEIEAMKFILGDKMTLSNNLDYAYRIEYLKHSREKAPNGMLRRNVIKFQAFVDKNARGLK